MSACVRGLSAAVVARPRTPALRLHLVEVRIRSVAAHDEELAARLASGDEEALRELFRTYGPGAKAVAQRIVGSPTLADEVVQEAFLSVWQHAGNYRKELGSLRGWVFAAVHNRAVDAVRREQAIRRRVQEEETLHIPDADDIADEVVESDEVAEQRRRIRRALEHLPAEQRAVLERMYFEGRTQAAISEETGIPLGTVKSRTLLAMRRLRKELGVDP
jgi:RNA polymerase sigma-70 factor (ECF subfamily)